MKDLTYAPTLTELSTIFALSRWHSLYRMVSSLPLFLFPYGAANRILIWITLPDMVYAILISFHVVSVCSLEIYGEQSQV